MARIIYTAIVDSIRGSIGGTCFQKNKHGYTVKKKPNMVHPRTSMQSSRKAILSLVTRAWRDLTPTQRTAYATFASSFPQYAKHSPTSQLSGYEVFVKYNTLRFLYGSAVLSTITQAIPDTDTLTYEIENDAGVLYMNITSTTADDGWRILFFVSRVFSASRNFIGTSPKFIRGCLNSVTQFDFDDEYELIYGSLPATDDIVAMDALLISNDSPYVLARDSQLYVVV